MPDDEQIPTTRTNGATWADVAIHAIDALRDIFNDWKTWALIGIVLLVLVGAISGEQIVDGVERWIHAWRGTG